MPTPRRVLRAVTPRRVLGSLAALVANAYYTARLINRLKEASGEVEASRVEIQQSRRTLLALFDGIPNPLYIVDSEYTLIALNKTAARTDRVRAGEASKREPKDLVGRRCYQVLYRRKEPCEGCRVAETLRAGASQHREVIPTDRGARQLMKILESLAELEPRTGASSPTRDSANDQGES